MDKASDFGSEDWEFESPRDHVYCFASSSHCTWAWKEPFFISLKQVRVLGSTPTRS